MRLVIQRVTKASVSVANQPPASISMGFLLLVAFSNSDTREIVSKIAAKTAGLRLFADSSGKMNLSLKSVAGEVLAIPQFTLYGDVHRGFRPSFTKAAPPDQAQELFDYFVDYLHGLDLPVQTGFFRQHMSVQLINDGPVTIILDSDHL